MQYFSKRQLISRGSTNCIGKLTILIINVLIVYDSHALRNVQFRLPWRRKEVKQSTGSFIAEINYNRGDVLQLSSTGELLFATTRTSLIYIKPQMSSILCNICSWCTGLAEIHKIKDPSDFTRKSLAALIHDANKNWTPHFEKGINLGLLIGDRVVPYDMKYCNSNHYIDYLKTGKIQKARGCYLARDMTKITALGVLNKDFYLEDVNGKKFLPYHSQVVIATKLIPSGQVDSIGDGGEAPPGPPPATS